MKELIGLAVLAWPLTLAAIIVLALVGVTSTVWYLTRGKKGHWAWTLSAALLVYLSVFWDHIPTVVMHKYYCEKEAGFWVYKTLDQWKKENPGVMETLVANKNDPSSRTGDMVNYTDTYFANQRFNLIVKHGGQYPLNRWRHERLLVDVNTGEVLARYVNFSTSQEQRQAGWSGWKFWLDTRYCTGGKDRLTDFGKFFLQFKGVGK